MFTAEDIRQRVKEQQPFVPVRIVTSSGQSYDVTHPDLIMVGKRFLQVGVASNDNPTIFEVVNRVAIMHVSDLQDIPHETPSGTNGPPSK
jgi:hypothetical protein